MRYHLLAALLLTLIASPGTAQSTGNDSTLIELLREANRRGRYIRVFASEGAIPGRISELSAETVRFPGRRVSLADIQQVDARITRGGGTLPGAITGAAIVSVLGIGAVHIYNDPSLVQIGSAIVIGSLIGGALGGIVGNLVRNPTVSWETEWKR